MSDDTTPGSERHDAVVVGGGIAGLAAAALLVRAGLDVALFERSSALGGRARTLTEEGFRFNFGPHALYRAGPGADVLRSLDAFPEGGSPETAGAALVGEGTEPLPTGPWAILRTGALGVRGKLDLLRAVARIERTDPASLAGIDVATWLDRLVSDDGARAVIRALIRLTTYAGSPEQAADAAAMQLRQATAGGVIYPDRGWQRIVDALRARASAAGVRIETRSPVTGVHHEGGRIRGVSVDGRRIEAGAVLLAVGPRDASRLPTPPLSALTAASEEAVPVRAATLDVGLRRLPRDTGFALGIDRPLYYSVHSRWAELAPDEGELLHVARYSTGEEQGADSVEAELEGVLDRLQPGWREEVVVRRFLPRMTVANALVRAPEGLAGRPGPAVPGVDGLFVAGDWVGGEGLLSDAALASAAAAARSIVERKREEGTTDGQVARRRVG